MKIITGISKLLALAQLINNVANKDTKKRAKIGRNISNVRNAMYVMKK